MDYEGVGVRVGSGTAARNRYVRQETTTAWTSVANAGANGSALGEEPAGLGEGPAVWGTEREERLRDDVWDLDLSRQVDLLYTILDLSVFLCQVLLLLEF